MKKHFWKATVAVLAAATIVSCTGKKFEINGNITQAKDSVLYLENMSLKEGVVVIDSAKLGENGAFAFAEKATEAPEFYRLRIANQVINLSVDSTETIIVKASYPTMATQYEVEGSENCQKIKELALRQIDLTNRAIAIQQDRTLGIDATADSIQKLVNAYKEDIKQNYIYKEPMKAYAYFALFQTLGRQLIFDPQQNADDIKVFAAVATSWDTYYPDALRGKNLHNIALKGMNDMRIVDAQRQNLQIDASKVSEASILDIALPDNKGNIQRLTNLKGKVVLLDFHLFATSESTERIMMLRDLYNKYHDRGFEIYQVSIDPDEHFWKTQTEALPWISVRDDKGANSANLVMYNVQSLPTFFLIDRTNTLHKRDVQIKNLNAEIESLL